MNRVTFIVPVLNEGRGVEPFLVALQPLRRAGHQVIVVDGGSEDDSFERAHAGADLVLRSPQPCRALQQNLGTERADGELLVFLHADTRLPESAAAILAELLSRRAPWGWFDARLDAAGGLYRLIETMMNYRARFTGVCTGDQALFVSRALFDRVGGFPRQALMEDVEISSRLRRLARPEVRSERVLTSARRWIQSGPLRTIGLMWWLRLAYALGVDSDRIARWYGSAIAPR